MNLTVYPADSARLPIWTGLARPYTPVGVFQQGSLLFLVLLDVNGNLSRTAAGQGSIRALLAWAEAIARGEHA